MNRELELTTKITELERTIAEQKSTILSLSKEVEEYRRKEQSISNAIIASMEHANQLEASRKKLYMLDIQRSRLLYLRMEQVINELYARYPELTKDTKLKEMSDKFRTLVYNDLNDKNKESAMELKTQPVDDPIKKLLHNIIDRFETKKPDTEFKVIEQKPASSGFDFNEALHPTMGLDEIMKEFNLGTDDKDKK